MGLSFGLHVRVCGTLYAVCLRACISPMYHPFESLSLCQPHEQGVELS